MAIARASGNGRRLVVAGAMLGLLSLVAGSGLLVLAQGPEAAAQSAGEGHTNLVRSGSEPGNAPAGCLPGFSIVPSASSEGNPSFLVAAVALAPNNVWAVGIYYSSNGAQRTLIERWNGSQWS